MGDSAQIDARRVVDPNAVQRFALSTVAAERDHAQPLDGAFLCAAGCSVAYTIRPYQTLKRQNVIEQGREVEQAIAALTKELIKLSPLQGDELANLSITIENAISRLALAIMAKTTDEVQEECIEAIEAAAAV
jgi:hypothetical protein